MRTLLVLWLVILSAPLVGQATSKYFEYTPLAREAYRSAVSLRFGEAYARMAQLRLKEPDNLICLHIENYIDFFKVYIREDETEYRRLKQKAVERLRTVETGDEQSPYYRFVQADIRLQWALVKLRFEDYIGAFKDVSRAHKLLQQNQSLFPDFMPNKKDLGILHAMVGTIPDSYQWGIKLLGGLEGTIEQGRREIETVLAYAQREDFLFEQETRVLYAFLLLHLDNKEDAAWRAINAGGLTPRENPIHCFVMANIAMRTGRNDRAIQLLKQQPRGKITIDFPYLDYMLGLAKLRRLDADAAPYFQAYLRRYRGRNFVKEAYQKMAWQALLSGDQSGYRKHMEYCLTRGYATAGGDKNAQREAKAGHAPNLSLLQARLLFDGGYHEKGYALLAAQSGATYQGRDALEYTYRLGRLCHGKGDAAQALEYYQKTINAGKDSPHYFACNAALQMGLLYESRGQRKQAAAAFQQCLALKPDEYRTGLHQKAKAGLARLGD